MSRVVYYDQQGNEVELPEAEPVSETNGDRIRAMTDEELADEYIRIYHRLGWYTDSWAWLRKWLKSPAEVEE
jgi:hypothetical protein